MRKEKFGQWKRPASKIFWITVAWVAISIFQFLISYSTLVQFHCTNQTPGPWHYLPISITSGVVAGILGGTIIVFLWERWLRSVPYGRALFYMFLSFSVIYFVVNLIGMVKVRSLESHLPVFHPELVRNLFQDFLQVVRLSSYFFWLVIVLITFLVFQVNDKYGPGVFRDFLLGRYFHPHREDRIFMFLDMRSSTPIAEQLGEEKFFMLIRELFADITPPILQAGGEIYQYIGDEIIISWKMRNGLYNANCLNCFFDIQKTIHHNAPAYQRKYGLLPQFKAGLHCGTVMTGEIGLVKKDIAFYGDVLNTAARIQSKCNDLGVNILFSGSLYDLLPTVGQEIAPMEVGHIPLRGKQTSVLLYTV